jgi:hypothetical protein
MMVISRVEKRIATLGAYCKVELLCNGNQYETTRSLQLMTPVMNGKCQHELDSYYQFHVSSSTIALPPIGCPACTIVESCGEMFRSFTRSRSVGETVYLMFELRLALAIRPGIARGNILYCRSPTAHSIHRRTKGVSRVQVQLQDPLRTPELSQCSAAAFASLKTRPSVKKIGRSI